MQKENKMLLESTNSIPLFDQLSYKFYKQKIKSHLTNFMINIISITLDRFSQVGRKMLYDNMNARKSRTFLYIFIYLRIQQSSRQKKIS